jgi:hypothetical protein
MSGIEHRNDDEPIREWLHRLIGNTPEAETIARAFEAVERQAREQAARGAVDLIRQHRDIYAPGSRAREALNGLLCDIEGHPAPTEDTALNVLARVIENRHGMLPGIGDTLREALTELNRGSTDGV